jgi:hypothetical protein
MCHPFLSRGTRGILSLRFFPKPLQEADFLPDIYARGRKYQKPEARNMLKIGRIREKEK